MSIYRNTVSPYEIFYVIAVIDSVRRESTLTAILKLKVTECTRNKVCKLTKKTGPLTRFFLKPFPILAQLAARHPLVDQVLPVRVRPKVTVYFLLLNPTC